MARLTFKQGIVRHQEDNIGNQGFLDVVNGFVSLIVSNESTVIAFTHGTKDYLFTESNTINNAWGPFPTGANYWLFWELNPVTGIRSFGSTIFEPITQSQAPTSPSISQMWFNTAVSMWYEWNGTSWVEVIRVFACKIDTGLAPRSLSINAPDFKGTQVGLDVNNRTGSLVFDSTGKPIKNDSGKFFTTEDVFTTGVPTGASLRVNNILMSGQAQQPIANFQVVEYSDFNKLVPASPFTQGENAFGIVAEGVPVNAIANFTTEGIIFNEQWDWVADGASVNDPVYINGTGMLLLTQYLPNQQPAGVVIGRQEILFAPRLFPQLDIVGGVGGVESFPELLDTPSGYVGKAGAYVTVTSTEDGLEFSTNPGFVTDVSWGDILGNVVDQIDLSNILNAKADNIHVHAIGDVTGLQNTIDTLNTDINGKVDRAGDTMTGDLTMDTGTNVILTDQPTNNSDAANKLYVDQIASGIKARPAVNVYLDAPLSTIQGGQVIAYNNGALGVGSTLTNNPSVGALSNIDGIPMVVGMRILIANEVQSETNGIYTITDVGAVGSSFLLTRCEVCDESNEIPSSYVFIQQGTTYSDTAYVASVANPSTFVIGTDAITFVQFGGGQDNFRIIDGDLDTYISVENNPTIDSDIIVARVGDNTNTFNTVDSLLTLSAPSVELRSLDAATTNINAATLNILSGSASGTGLGGDITVTAGNGNTGGSVNIAGGDANAGSNTDIGGGLLLSGGIATNGVGGNVYLRGGLALTGSSGYVAIDRQQNNTNSTEFRFISGLNSSNYVGLQSPNSVISNTTYTLPTNDGVFGDTLLTDGSGQMSWGTVSGLPTSTTQCAVLISDNAGGWVESPMPELPRLYDIAGQVAGVAPASASIMKFVAPHYLQLPDYGHRATFTDGGVATSVQPDTEFSLYINGVQKGLIGFFGGVNQGVSFNIGNDFGASSFAGSFITIAPGDIIEIRSPAAPNLLMTDVAITLRAFADPIGANPLQPSPCSIGVLFDKDALASESYSDVIGMTYTGSIVYAEWAVVGIVPFGALPPTGIRGIDTLTSYKPEEAVTFDVPDTLTATFETNSVVHKTTSLSAPVYATFINTSSNNSHVLVRCTVFGPAGISTDVAWVDVVANLPPPPGTLPSEF